MAESPKRLSMSFFAFYFSPTVVVVVVVNVVVIVVNALAPKTGFDFEEKFSYSERIFLTVKIVLGGKKPDQQKI